MLKIVECPRDAMQGIGEWIPTEKKVAYINQLLKVGFDTIDFGSFVSPKAIPQMRDTAEVLQLLRLEGTRSKLLAIVANYRGAEEACRFPEITFLGFPLSLSETFQLRNTNKSIAEALHTLADIQNICLKNKKVLVTYLSMGFGNPYGDPYAPELVAEFVQKLASMELSIVSLADTIGTSTPESISQLFLELIPAFPGIELGAHLHSTPETAAAKITAAYHVGCLRLDGAIMGLGGCPMAEDKLVGNIGTEVIVSLAATWQVSTGLNRGEFEAACKMAEQVFLSR